MKTSRLQPLPIAAWATALFLATAPAAAQDAPPEAVRMTLDEAIATAIERNPGLAAADASRDQVTADRLASLGRFLPSLDLSYGYATSNTGRLDPTGQTISRTSHSAQLNARYDLFSGFRRVHDFRATGLRLAAEDASFEDEEWATVTAVKEAWFAAVAARELLRVEEDRVERQRDQLDFAERLVALGRATRSDQLRSSVDLNNARLARMTAAATVQETAFDLAEVVGLERPVEPDPRTTLEIGPIPVGREEAIEIARTSSPALVASRAAARAAEVSVSVAEAAWWPSLSMNAGTAWRNEEFPPDDRSWSVSVQASYPLFNGFQRESAIRRAAATSRASEANHRSTELALLADVDAAYNRIEVARAAVDLARETVELATEDLRVTEERYRVGLATILDLQASQIALREAEVELVQRQFDYAIGVARLESLLGRELR